MQTLSLTASKAAHPVASARCRTLGGHTVCASVGARPGYMSFKESAGSVQFTSGSSSTPTPSGDDAANVGPAVGGHPGYMGFTRSGNGAASLSSGTVDFTGAVAEAASKKNLVEQWRSDSQSLQQKIQSFGVAGVAAYGLFNTLYYTGAFLFCWLYVAKVPQGLGMAAAARKFVEVLALVWAGSQVTKVPRALGALAFAPLVDRGLSAIKSGLKLKSKQQAFWTLVAGCLVLAALLFGMVVLTWA